MSCDHLICVSNVTKSSLRDARTPEPREIALNTKNHIRGETIKEKDNVCKYKISKQSNSIMKPFISKPKLRSYKIS